MRIAHLTIAVLILGAPVAQSATLGPELVPEITHRCERLWPTALSRRADCIENQTLAALRAIREFNAAPLDVRLVTQACFEQWRDHATYNFRAVRWCVRHRSK